ncbi:hypothetical protein [Ruminococcus sp. NK3A76]|uniref:hypothetical protein n=1 Tax=Ruminococcus sp. NK3A76 TaxID=877411 RepID=UPI0012ECB9AF|nr:hypothetical protein [Ruminococcus sp. NK3A76]
MNNLVMDNDYEELKRLIDICTELGIGADDFTDTETDLDVKTKQRIMNSVLRKTGIG